MSAVNYGSWISSMNSWLQQPGQDTQANVDAIRAQAKAIGVDPNDIADPGSQPPPYSPPVDPPPTYTFSEDSPPPPPPYKPGDSSSQSSGPDDFKPGKFSIKAPTAAFSQDQTKQMAVDLVHAFMEKGLTKEQSIGIVASLKLESNLDPSIKQGGGFLKDLSSTGDVVNQTGEGMVQWGEERLNNMIAFAKSKGLPSTSPEAQVDFMMEEADKMGILNKIKNGPDDASAACHVWTSEYEIASEPNMDSRVNNISQIRDWVG